MKALFFLHYKGCQYPQHENDTGRSEAPELMPLKSQS